MWQQNYMPVADSLALSTVVAAIPIFVLLLLIGILRKPAWIAALAGLARRCSWPWASTACRRALL